MSNPNWPGSPESPGEGQAPQQPSSPPGWQPQVPAEQPSGLPPDASYGQPPTYPYTPAPAQPDPFAPPPATPNPYAQPATPNPYAPPPTPDPYAPAPQAPVESPLYAQQGMPETTSPSGFPPAQPGMADPNVQAGLPYSPPAAPSQPMYGAPSQPMYGAPGQPSYGAPGQFGQIAQPRKRSLRGLWIALAIVVVLLALAGGGVVYALSQLAAPAAAAISFCNDLKTQSYTPAYQLLSAKLQGQFTQVQFTQGSQALDTVEGTVTSCKQGTGNAYAYSFGGTTATLQAVITRSKQGDLSGTIHLKSENGTWKVDGLDTSLLGANLASLQETLTFCTALAAKDYSSAYSQLGIVAQGQLTATQFTAQGTLHDQIDGPVTGCTLVALGSGNDDTTTSLTVSVTRATLGARTGNVTLDVESGAWKVAKVDLALLGTDLGPLLVGQQFCTALQAGQYTAAFGLLSTTAQTGHKPDELALPSGLSYAGCDPDLSTYKVTTSSASFNANLKVKDAASGLTVPLGITLKFVVEGGNWKIDDFSTNS